MQTHSIARVVLGTSITLVPMGGSSATANSDAPLVVNGRAVTERQLERWLIEGPCRLKLEEHVSAFLIDNEIARRADEAAAKVVGPETWRLAHAAGPPDPALAAEARASCAAARKLEGERIRGALVPTAQESLDEWQRNAAEFQEKYPTLEFDVECRRTFRATEWGRAYTCQQMLFDRVFRPDDPADWPALTVAAVRADSGEVLIDDAKQSYAARKEAAIRSGGPITPEDRIYCSMLRQIVRDSLRSTITFKSSFDGLPDDIVLTADVNGDGQPELVLTTDEMWREVRDTVVPTESEDAKQWFVTSMATTDRLRRDGYLLDGAACSETIGALRTKFAAQSFGFEVHAAQTAQFPSVEAYEEYCCLRKGFETRIAPELVNGANGELARPLLDHLPRAKAALAYGQVDAECIWISPLDIPNFRWKPDGWAGARNTAHDLRMEIDAAHSADLAEQAHSAGSTQELASGVNLSRHWSVWDKALDDHSAFWDPPLAANGTNCRGPAANRGRFGLLRTEDLRSKLGESAYSDWVTGHSTTEFVAIDQPVDSVAGPFRGPKGYYLTRVKARTPAAAKLNIKKAQDVETLREDYVRVAFIEYARDAVAHATVRGFVREP